ncbi:hypothetical protein GF367_00510 [Candidatus Woesearchaeota archaeon]|nr:hypothetical protein [Candidatus Woesearchaeota archaeon]
MKKGQAAMEFLMTYGWAILVVLAAIGALAYFGVLSPGNLLPEKTTFKAPFLNTESAVITIGGGNISVQVPFTNGQGKSVTINESAGASSTGDCNVAAAGVSADDATPTNGQAFVLTWACGNPNSLQSGDKFKADLSFTYKTDTGLNRVHSGEVVGKIQ